MWRIPNFAGQSDFQSTPVPVRLRIPASCNIPKSRHNGDHGIPICTILNHRAAIAAPVVVFSMHKLNSTRGIILKCDAIAGEIVIVELQARDRVVISDAHHIACDGVICRFKAVGTADILTGCHFQSSG